MVSHDVDIEKYANEVYEFNNHKLTCIKKENKNSHFEKENHTYKLKTHKIFLHYSFSIFFVLLLNTILSSMFFTLTYFGAFANKDDSFIYLKQAFEEEGYLIFDAQNDVTSSYLLKKFNGSCFKAYNTTIPVGTIDGDGKENTVYCTTKTFEKYAKVDKLIAKKKLIPKYSSLSYTIEIDDTLKDGIFFQKENSSVIDDYQFYKRFNYAFYDTDEFTKDELKNKYGEITIISESFYKRSNSLNHKLDDDTFYVSTRKLLSTKIVTEFLTPYYYSKNDNYEPNLNRLFPNGIKTKALDKLDENQIIPHIVVSDNTAKKFLTDHDPLILIKDKKYLMNTFYLYNKNYIVQNCNYFDTDLVLQKYKDFAQNKINVSLFTYSIMLYFFFIFNLFLEYIVYFNIVSKNQHNFFLLYAFGMGKKQIFIHSIIPIIISLMLSSLIGGLIALTQTKGFTFFISGIPLFILFILLFVLISILIFKKGIKRHE